MISDELVPEEMDRLLFRMRRLEAVIDTLGMEYVGLKRKLTEAIAQNSGLREAVKIESQKLLKRRDQRMAILEGRLDALYHLLLDFDKRCAEMETRDA